MNGNLFSDHLYSARILAEHYFVDLPIISQILDLDHDTLASIALNQNWQLQKIGPQNLDPSHFDMERGAAQVSTLAAQISRLLQRQLNCIESEGKAEAFSEGKTKSLLSITKALQTLEDMITRMEAALERAGQFPTDILEFREKLEKQMAVFSKQKTAD